MIQNLCRVAGWLKYNQEERDRFVAESAKSLPPGTKVLDVGAGTCVYASLFSHCVYKTQDFGAYQGKENGFFKDKWRYGKIDYFCDITMIPVPDQSFDALLCTEVLEHIPEPILALKEFSRILRKGGRLFITAPLGCGLHQQPFHFYGGFTPFFYQKFLPELGFEVKRIIPNGGFFKNLSQEIGRAGDILSKKHYRKRPFSSFLTYLIFKRLLPVYLYPLDKKHFFEEFTVEYFVEAEKII